MRQTSPSFFVFGLMLVASTFVLAGTTAKSKDGKLEVNLPQDWEQTTLPNSKGKIDAKNTTAGGYTSIIVENIEDFDSLELKDYAKKCMDASVRASKLKNRHTEDPQEITVNGKPAVRYEVTGSINGIKLKFWFTFIKTETMFVQVMTWSSPSHFDQNKDAFEFIDGHIVEHTAN